ncbi:MAG: PxKF domain-containing protein [Gaiellaceae bacterium]
MAAVGVGVVFAVAGGALADRIYNSLDATIDPSFETLALNQNGSTQTVTYAVNPTNGDGKNGCNLTSSTTLGVSVNTSNSSAATVSPTSLTFSSCGDVKTITVTPHSAGSANITLAQTSNNTGGTFDLTTASFTVNVAPPANTAPTVTISGVSNGGDYSKGSVPTAVCHVSDTEDGLSNSTSAATPTLSAITGPYAADGIGQQTATCSYTDGGGLTTAASATYTISDPSAPSITYTLNPASPSGLNGWYKSDVTLTWNVSEPQSPNSVTKTGCVDQNITADQPSTNYSCSATSAGGSTGPVAVAIKRDAAAPSVSCGSADANWHVDDVSIACTASDTGGSGLADSNDASFNLSTSVSSGTETNNALTGSRTVYDAAGNSATAGPIGDNKIDRKAPTYSCGAAPTAWSASDITIDCTASDGGSGLSSASDGTFSLSTSVAPGTETGSASTGSKALTDGVGNTVTAGPITDLKVDKKAPTYSCGAAPTAWSASDITINCTASDGGSGLSSASDGTFSLSTSVAPGTETGSASTGSKLLTDGVGHSATAGPITDLKVDKKKPTISDDGTTQSPNGNDGTLDWYNHDVTVNFSATDGGSGLASSCSSPWTALTSGQGVGVTASSGACADAVGNSNAGVTSSGYNVDKAKPTISGAVTSPSSVDGNNGWYKTAPTVTFTCGDTTSGVASCVADDASPASASITLGESASAQSVGGTATDNASNTQTFSVTGLKVDLSNPSVTCPAVPTFMASQLPATITAGVSDAISGPATAPATGQATNANGGTVNITGYDKAGRFSTVSCAYHVASTSFLSPVDGAPTMNIAKLGRVVPVKSTITYDGSPVLAGSTVYVGGQSKVDCALGTAADDLETYADAGLSNAGTNMFRWDTTGQFWIYNFDTSAFKLQVGNCYKISVYYGGGNVSNGTASGGALAGYFLLKTTK